MTPQEQVLIVQWARQLERDYDGLTGSHIQAPPGMTLGLAFKLLADCAAAGIGAARQGVLHTGMLDDPASPRYG